MIVISNVLQASCDFFKDCLNTEIQIDDNVFEKGANSLTIIKWSSFLAKKFGLILDYQMLYEYQTIRTVIEHMDIDVCAEKSSASCLSNDSERKKKNQKVPLCSAQKGLWLHDKLYGNNDFVLCAYTKIEGTIDIEQMKSAISNVIKKNDIFSMKFADDKSTGPYQYAASDGETINIETMHIDGDLSLNDKIDTLKKTITLETPYGFLILSDNTNAHYIVYALHHIIADEETFEILNREVLKNYSANSDASANKRTYLDYCDCKDKEEVEGTLLYWESVLTPEKVNKHREYKKDQYVKSIEFYLNSHDVERLKEYALNNKTSLYVAFTSLVSVALYLSFGKKKFFICSAISDRVNYPEHMDTCGMFVNNVLLEANLNYKFQFSDVFTQINDVFNKAFEHSNLAIDDMVRLSDKIDAKYAQLQSDIVFNFIDLNRKSSIFDEFTAFPMKYVVGPQNRINIYVQHIDDEYVCNIDCWDQSLSIEDIQEIGKWIVKQLTEDLYLSETEIINY